MKNRGKRKIGGERENRNGGERKIGGLNGIGGKVDKKQK